MRLAWRVDSLTDRSVQITGPMMTTQGVPRWIAAVFVLLVVPWWCAVLFGVLGMLAFLPVEGLAVLLSIAHHEDARVLQSVCSVLGLAFGLVVAVLMVFGRRVAVMDEVGVDVSVWLGPKRMLTNLRTPWSRVRSIGVSPDRRMILDLGRRRFSLGPGLEDVDAQSALLKMEELRSKREKLDGPQQQ